MHILKIKQQDGTWVEVPALIGPQGERGPQIDSYTKAETNAKLDDKADAIKATVSGELITKKAVEIFKAYGTDKISVLKMK